MKRLFLLQPNRLIRKFYKKAVWRIDANSKNIYLTFDDGPIPELTGWVLDQLKLFDAKATFFCVGENINKNPKIFERIQNEGHQVGNHTMKHAKGFHSSLKDYLTSIENCETLTKTKLFRPPYGQLSKMQYRALIKKGFKIVFWDVISYDYEKISPEICFKIVSSRIRKGSIVLFHDNMKAEKNLKYTLPKILEKFSSEGYSFKKIN